MSEVFFAIFIALVSGALGVAGGYALGAASLLKLLLKSQALKDSWEANINMYNASRKFWKQR